MFFIELNFKFVCDNVVIQCGALQTILTSHYSEIGLMANKPPMDKWPTCQVKNVPELGTRYVLSYLSQHHLIIDINESNAM